MLALVLESELESALALELVLVLASESVLELVLELALVLVLELELALELVSELESGLELVLELVLAWGWCWSRSWGWSWCWCRSWRRESQLTSRAPHGILPIAFRSRPRRQPIEVFGIIPDKLTHIGHRVDDGLLQNRVGHGGRSYLVLVIDAEGQIVVIGPCAV